MYKWAEFRHFKYLLAILELRGFRAASEQLFTAQSNLSIQAKQFQESASVRHYDKTKDGRIKPTDTGVAFTFIAKDVLDTRAEAIEALIAIVLSRPSVYATRNRYQSGPARLKSPSFLLRVIGPVETRCLLNLGLGADVVAHPLK